MIDLSLCIIARNEQENLDQCLRSVKAHVGQIIVVDTGSTDRTIEVAEHHGGKVYPHDPHTNPESFFTDDEMTCSSFGAPPPYGGEVMLGDFGAARRASFARATGEFILWLDCDDVLEGAEHLPKIVEAMRSQKLDMGFFAYDYARDHAERTFYRQWRERIIRRGCADWVNPVHEVLMPTRPVASQRFEGVTVVHRRKADRPCPPNRNYKILLRQLATDKRNGTSVDPRTLFYLGQEARWVEPVKAAAFYEDYLARSGWPEERAAAHVALGSMREFGQLGGQPAENYAMADREYAVAAAEMPGNPDGLYGLARIAYHRQRWAECIDYTTRANAIGNTESMLGANPMDRLYRPHIFLNHALGNLGRLEEAIASCRAGLAVAPDDPGVPGGAVGMLKHNLAVYEAELAARAAPPKSGEAKRVDFSKDEDVDAPPQEGIPRDALVIWATQLWKQVAHAERAGSQALDFLDALPAAVKADDVHGRMLAATRRMFPDATTTLAKAQGISETALKLAEIAQRPSPYESLGKGLARDDKKLKVDNQSAPPQGGGMRIVFYLGPCFEKWDPRSIDSPGIGGSETAAIHMARELAALGHQVRVYADPPDVGGRFDGVSYVNHQAFGVGTGGWRERDGKAEWIGPTEPGAGITCDVFIASRAPWAISQFGEVRAKVKLLWVHDVNVGPDSPQMERWLLGFDRVLCLSQWHKAHFCQSYPTLDSSRVLVTRNGIDPARFETAPGKLTVTVPHKKNHLIWSSSPPRRLDLMLTNFPLIRAQVPDAELHVFYGFDCWETFAKARNNEAELAQIAWFKERLPPVGQSRDGVHYHGRVGQAELAQAFMRAKVWPYLTDFPETSCISAMEAQAAGCVPVCSDLAALSETVKHGVLVKNEAPGAPQQWLNAVIRALKDEEWRRPMAEAGRKYALENLSWKALAAEWIAMFGRVAGELAVDPLPKFVEVR